MVGNELEGRRNGVGEVMSSRCTLENCRETDNEWAREGGRCAPEVTSADDAAVVAPADISAPMLNVSCSMASIASSSRFPDMRPTL
jgi:hypothetical protein